MIGGKERTEGVRGRLQENLVESLIDEREFKNRVPDEDILRLDCIPRSLLSKKGRSIIFLYDSDPMRLPVEVQCT